MVYGLVKLVQAAFSRSQPELKTSRQASMKQAKGESLTQKNTQPGLSIRERLWRVTQYTVTLGFALPLIALSISLLLYSLELGHEEMSYLYWTYNLAWAFYLVMGIFWIADIRLGMTVSIAGTVFGVVSVLSIAITIWPLLVLIPPIIMATQMTRFHSGQVADNSDPAPV